MRLLERLPLALLLAIRTHTGRQRALTALTVLAIATSVALATGLEASSRSVERELERTADELSGAAEIEVTGGTLGVPEVALARAAAVPGVRVAAPLVEVTVRIRSGPGTGEALHVIGVDLLTDPDVRTYAWSGAAVELQDPLRMLARLDSVIVTESFAARFGIVPGDPDLLPIFGPFAVSLLRLGFSSF
jgi:ABC-type lipoprotein release transport system permease subunit